MASYLNTSLSWAWGGLFGVLFQMYETPSTIRRPSWHAWTLHRKHEIQTRYSISWTSCKRLALCDALQGSRGHMAFLDDLEEEQTILTRPCTGWVRTACWKLVGRSGYNVSRRGLGVTLLSGIRRFESRSGGYRFLQRWILARWWLFS